MTVLAPHLGLSSLTLTLHRRFAHQSFIAPRIHVRAPSFPDLSQDPCRLRGQLMPPIILACANKDHEHPLPESIRQPAVKPGLFHVAFLTPNTSVNTIDHRVIFIYWMLDNGQDLSHAFGTAE